MRGGRREMRQRVKGFGSGLETQTGEFVQVQGRRDIGSGFMLLLAA